MSRSSNVPISTSERFLRQHGDSLASEEPARDLSTPELDHVIGHLAQRLSVVEPEAELPELLARLEALETSASELAEKITEAEEIEADAFARASTVVLSSFPYLDDPWHPMHDAQFVAQREEIRRLMATSREVADYGRAVEAMIELDHSLWELRDEMAPLESLVRALQARDLARRLATRGGPDWERYQRFRACEIEEPERAAGE